MNSTKVYFNSLKIKYLFSIALFFFFIIPYAIIPMAFMYEFSPFISSKLISVTLLGISTIIITLFIPTFKINLLKKSNLNFSKFIKIVFILFYILILIIFLTAPSIPILDAIFRGNNTDLSTSREDFLKTRIGWEKSLGYLIGMLTSYIIPYLISFSHFHKKKCRWFYTITFFLYCISFLEKAFFLKVAIPLFFVYMILSKKPILLFFKGLILILLLFYIMFIVSGSTEGVGNNNNFEFLSIYYGGGSNVFMNIIWRMTVVPIVTAFDGLNLFYYDFGNNYFFGRTSSFISFLMNEKWINFERLLFISQFGGNGFGNANQVYLIEAYINFGYYGVFFFSFVIGNFIKKAISSKDYVYITIMPLFLYNLFNAGLIGNMLSNGYLAFFLILCFFKIK